MGPGAFSEFNAFSQLEGLKVGYVSLKSQGLFVMFSIISVIVVLCRLIATSVGNYNEFRSAALLFTLIGMLCYLLGVLLFGETRQGGTRRWP